MFTINETMQNKFVHWLRTQALLRHTTYMLVNQSLQVVASDPELPSWCDNPTTPIVGCYLPGIFPELIGSELNLVYLATGGRGDVAIPKIWRVAADGTDQYFNVCAQAMPSLGAYVLVKVEEVTDQTCMAHKVQQQQDEIRMMRAQIKQLNQKLEMAMKQTAVSRQPASISDGDSSPSLSYMKREATVLFVDMRRFTTMPSQLSPHITFRSINKYFQTVADVVYEHQGTVMQASGDYMMAAFNVLADHAHHAFQAAQAAIAIRDTIQKMVKEDGLHDTQACQFGLSINTGPVMTGYIGTHEHYEYRAVGDTANVASQLCEKATGGRILIGAETFRHLYGRAIIKTYGGIRLKNQAMTAVYELCNLTRRVGVAV